MSQTPSGAPPNPRTQRTFAGMIGAMAVAVAVAGGWYLLGRPSDDTGPVQRVEWHTWVHAGRADHKLSLQAPATLPAGWGATSAEYQSGVSPHWHLGLLSRSNKYVGVEESYDFSDDVIHQYVDKNASQGKDTTVGGTVWQTWTDSGGDYALIRTLIAPNGQQERVLVYGSAPDAEIRSFAATLSATS